MAFTEMCLVGLGKYFFVMQQCLPLITLFLVLLSMIFLTLIAAIFHEITVGALLRFNVIHSGDAAVSTTYVCLCLRRVAHIY
jgi:hypothetical protein